MLIDFCLKYEAKLVPVGYGIKKLQIMMTIVDDLVSVDTLVEDHLTAEPANEYIQSCDIVAFNKICKYISSFLNFTESTHYAYFCLLLLIRRIIMDFFL